MRINHSLKNVAIGIFSQIIIVLLGFISRKIFLDNLGVSYLGVNGLLTNVLSMLGLVESGIGLSIVYNLYKPLAENDIQQVVALVQLYKKAYTVLAIIIFSLSLALYPFLGTITKNNSVPYITIIYFLFVAKNMISYLNAHKWSLINADQKGYILAKINLIFHIFTSIVKILILVLTHNYIIYLVMELLLYIYQSIYNTRVVNSRYPYIQTKEKYSIEASTKNNLINNIKALFLHNIGGYFVFGTDNILISSFIGVASVGLYSNYTLIIDQLSAFLMPILSGIGASVGNLIATESSNKSYSIFKITYLLNFWIYSLCTILLYNLLEPFINFWLGKGFLLEPLTFLFILINFYLTGLRSSVLTFKNKAGLFVQDKYVPIIEALINLISSIILIHYFGMAGVFMGTTISTLLTVFWTQPVIAYKHLFKVPVWTYFIKYIYYTGLTLAICIITKSICGLINSGDNFLALTAKGVICLIVPNVIYIVLFYKHEEFQYLLNVLRTNLIKIRKNKAVAKSELKI